MGKSYDSYLPDSDFDPNPGTLMQTYNYMRLVLCVAPYYNSIP